MMDMHALKRKRTIILLGDIFSFYAALLLILAFRTGFSKHLVITHILSFSGVFGIWLIVFFLFNLYESDAINPTPRTIGKLLLAYTANFFFGILFFYASPDFGIAPKSNLILVALVSLVFVIILRRLAYHFFIGGFRKTIAFYGSESESELRNDVEQNGYFTLIQKPIKDLKELASLAIFPDILIVPEQMSVEEIAFFSTYSGEIARADSAYEMLFAKVPLARMNNEKALACMERRYSPWSVFARTIEVIFAFFVLVVTLPITVIAALAIKLDDGPLFIRQERVGKNDRTFMLYKFRTMKALAPDGSAEIAGAVWAKENDPRITAVGAVLRKTHIDEIPQMWNIIKGDLALVGPRAERPEFVEQLKKDIPYYAIRHVIRPGFTGWAQIKYRYARSVSDSRDKFEYDLFYIKNRSLLLDIGIVIKTIQIIFTH